MGEAYKRVSAQSVSTAPRSVGSVEKDFRLHYERYKASRIRPRGMGAFHDFVLAAAYVGKPGRKSARHVFGYAALQLHNLDAAEGRWFDEGGNTQSAAMRSLRI